MSDTTFGIIFLIGLLVGVPLFFFLLAYGLGFIGNIYTKWYDFIFNSSTPKEEVNEDYNGVTRAHIGDRLVATIVDNIIIRSPLRVIYVFLTIGSNNSNLIILYGYLLVELISVLAYFAAYSYFNNGQTIGKKWNNLKVTTLEGNNLTLLRFMARELIARGIPILLAIFGLIRYANLWYPVTYVFALTKNRRALHDIIAGTQVVKSK